jgi:hypothetical protein
MLSVADFDSRAVSKETAGTLFGQPVIVVSIDVDECAKALDGDKAHTQAKLFVRCVRNPDGSRILADEEFEKVQKLHGALSEVADLNLKVMRINGLSEANFEDAKNS